MTVHARYSGTCPECGGRWTIGDEIQAILGARWPDPGWQHASCPDDPTDASLRPGEQVCTTCWLVHPEGACDR